MKAFSAYLLFVVLVSCTLHGCKEETPSTTEVTFVDQFYGNTTDLQLFVGYEEGAVPYTTFQGKSSWDITHKNLGKLLAGRNIVINTPRELSDMTALGILEQNNYTRQNIIDISAELQKRDNQGPSKGITLLFLDGYFIKDGQANELILGVNLDQTSTIAIFKPVIESSGSGQTTRTLVEQTTVVHEIGHALGLVNNGVRATSAHHDVQHGAHCTNEDCVMYWQNGGAEISQFIQPLLLGQDLDFFGDQCIADVTNK